MFVPLLIYEKVLSGYDCTIQLVFSNGKRKTTNLGGLTEQELNTIVLNIFAKDKNFFVIHLAKLYKKEERE